MHHETALWSSHFNRQRGNVLFMVLIAIVLIGLLTAAIQYSSRPEGANIDRETLLIRSTEVQRYASELERAITYIMQNGISESDIRFAHPEASADYGDLAADPDPTDQVFHRLGGAAEYRLPPSGINDGSVWEFYGGTHLPNVGTDRPELVVVLPNVTEQFCSQINELNGQSTIPADTGASNASGSDPGDCIHLGALGRFDDGRQFYDTSPNTANEASFEQDPVTGAPYQAKQACIQCDIGNAYHFYHVLIAR